MSGPLNAVVGDQDLPTNLPETEVADEFLAAEKRLARYSKTKEFQELKEYIEARISFFQTYLPDGKEIRFEDAGDNEGWIKWVVANNIVAEFRTLLNRYELAKQNVNKDAR